MRYHSDRCGDRPEDGPPDTSSPTKRITGGHPIPSPSTPIPGARPRGRVAIAAETARSILAGPTVPANGAARLVLIASVTLSTGALAGGVIDLATAPLVYHGADEGSRAGQSLASGGGVLGSSACLLTGAAFADPFGREGAGALYLAGATTDTGEEALNTVDYRIFGSQAGGSLGAAVSAGGDVNDDGIPDFVVGGWSIDVDGRVDCGAAYLYLGDPTLDGWDLPAQAFTSIAGRDPEDHLGWAVDLTGDLDGDGVADLVVGAPLGEGLGLATGEVFVFFGGAGFPSGALDPLDADVHLVIGETTAGFGQALAVGDLDGDEIDDLLVGAPGKDFSGRANAGAVYGFLGRASWPSLLQAPGDADLVIMGAFGPDGFGAVLDVVGDINDDGTDDLVVGAPFAPVGGNGLAGRAYVFGGGAFTPPLTLDARDDADSVLRGTARGDVAGVAVAGVGDLTGDGIADFVVGAPGYDPAGVADAGGAFFFAGSAAGFPSTGDLPSVAAWVYVGASEGEEAGAAVCGLGDFDGDSVDDLAIGAPGRDFGSLERAGGVYVVRGAPVVAVPGVADAGPFLGTPRPNPFRSSVALAVGPDAETARVVDVAGRLVRSLPVGDRRLVWDGRDAEGRSLAPGVYWIEARDAGGGTARTRVVLTR